ncbi:MAG TPA: TonB-dependent receptor plug domain-containing protein, partial [Phenylobacterium sp.]|nr:TonB-dependent receptor plug domain-containing protein [Phenylobacterium sp.]
MDFKVRRSAKGHWAAGASLSVLLGAWPLAAVADEAQADTAATVRSVLVDGSRGAYAPPPVSIGGKEPVSVLDVPNTVSVITRQRIEDQNLVTMVDALAQVPGVYVTTWDGLIGQIRSRGDLLDVSYDGIPAWNS